MRQTLLQNKAKLQPLLLQSLPLWAAGLLLLLVIVPAQADDSGDGARLTDSDWLAASYWDDGKAEIAFYEVERGHNQYGQAKSQRFPVGTYLVKHNFDPRTEAKASGGSRDGVPAFKYAIFYEFESGAYQYKRSYVVNAAQADLRPFKASLASFDWCSNLYRELAFRLDGTISSLMRSDDYGNRQLSFSHPEKAYPFSELPLLVRGLDFSASPSQQFQVVLDDGRAVEVVAKLAGSETLTTRAGSFDTEKITLSYGGDVPSLVGERAESVEHYWRSTAPGRHLVQLESASGSYRMKLIEELRSAYWRENFFPRLKNIQVRP